jgi:betaine-aldehyde dehydrogenase
MVIGDPLDPATHVGALISDEHMAKVLGYVESGIAQGEELLTGGNRVLRDGLDAGFFVEPAIFDGCIDDMDVVREEIFGPVMTVLTFDGESEVVARANDTEYGLAAGVFTKDLERAHRVVAALQAGTIWINTSGMGRENSLAAIDHYTQRKSVYVASGGVDSPY